MQHAYTTQFNYNNILSQQITTHHNNEHKEIYNIIDTRRTFIIITIYEFSPSHIFIKKTQKEGRINRFSQFVSQSGRNRNETK